MTKIRAILCKLGHHKHEKTHSYCRGFYIYTVKACDCGDVTVSRRFIDFWEFLAYKLLDLQAFLVGKKE